MGHFSVHTKIIAVLLGTKLFFGLSMILFAKTVIYQKLFAKIQEKGVVMAKETASDCINPVVTEELFEVEKRRRSGSGSGSIKLPANSMS